MSQDENNDMNNQYTLGLGKLSSDWKFITKDVKRAQDKDKMDFVRRERDRIEEIKRLECKRSQPIYRRTIYGKPNRSGMIKSLYNKAEDLRYKRGNILLTKSSKAFIYKR